MTSLIAACAPRPIEIGSPANDCAWAQGIYLSEDSIRALADVEAALRKEGEHLRALRVRSNRKAIGDHNVLYERWCTRVVEVR